MSVTGKVAKAGGVWGGERETPLQRFQNSFHVAANEGIRRRELERGAKERDGRTGLPKG